VTGTSVVGVKFNGGVALATDNLGTPISRFLVSPVPKSHSNLFCFLSQHRTDPSRASPT
jgi:hypothetical protein